MALRKKRVVCGEYVIAREPTLSERKDGWTMAYFEEPRPSLEYGLFWTGFIHMAKEYLSPARAAKTVRKLQDLHDRAGDGAKVFVMKKEDSIMEEANE